MQNQDYNEAQTRFQFIDPAIKKSWGIEQIRAEFPVTKGRMSFPTLVND